MSAYRSYVILLYYAVICIAAFLHTQIKVLDKREVVQVYRSSDKIQSISHTDVAVPT